ncbi:Clan SC, family S9, unassigned serine peptidase [Tritrichomonas foetus]|uniref:Clan SC, family S9, unassigned serine peptidase n=1 Tax=Tritrichomonas foetus TaxID=1144522 RepID=A0A1J4KZD7_9EUKA|nr:Clan SC, family S9, unassigned serine peptidase [Tritrichomonas foetus]|eukprot:OHT15052.1 Clan SC, family S9, unassigned serine peptidase [Tritrichomonas foetus]
MYQKGAKLIIRPPRHKYDFRSIPTNAEIPGFGPVERTSIAITNSREETIFGSFYRAPNPVQNTCCIYMHGNASNQLEGRYIVSLFVPIGISVFCFDFAGCGCSTGKYVSLGYFESKDVMLIMSMLETDFHIEQFLLWGRSMGAAVSLMIGEKSEKIKGIVADSSFMSIRSLISQLGKTKNLPEWFVKKSIKKVRKAIQEKANFDIKKVRPLSGAEKLTKPVFFIHGDDDKFVLKKNSERMFEKCPSLVKEIRIVPGEHNSERSQDTIMSATEFLCRSVGIVISFRRPRQQNPQQTSQNANQHFNNIDDMIKKM